MAGKPKSIDDYLSRLPDEQRAALDTMSKATVRALGGDLDGFDTSTGTIRFSPEKRARSRWKQLSLTARSAC